MNTQLIRASKIAFDLLFWLGIVALVVVLVAVGALPVIVDAVREHAGAFSASFLGAEFDVNLAALDVREAVRFGWAASLGMVVSLIASIYASHQIRRALRSVLRGSAFREENYGRLRRIAYAFFAVVPFGIISQSWMESVLHQGFRVSLDLQLGTIGFGLLALSVAEIYKAGISLQDDVELTV
ncbi:MAG: DUF2975 domain-containing protein [Myxococcota bacterium]